MKAGYRRIGLFGLILAALLLFAACAKEEMPETTPQEPAGETTPGTGGERTTAPGEEKSYAFLESPLCREMKENVRYDPDSPFRHAPNITSANPLVPVQAEFPKTVTINGRECAVGKQWFRLDRTIGFYIDTVDAFTDYSPSVEPSVYFDVVTGKITSIICVYLDVPEKGEELPVEEAYVVRARSAVAHHFPDVGIEQYEVDLNNMTADCGGLGSIIFVRKINGVETSSWVRVSFNDGKVISIQLCDSEDFNAFDTELLNYDKEEHSRLIESFAEYVCNGYEPQSIERTETTLVKTINGGYAMQYRLYIKMDTGEEYPPAENFTFQIALQ